MTASAAGPLVREIMRTTARLQQWALVLSRKGTGPLTERQAQLIAALETTTRPSVVARDLGVSVAVVTVIVNRLEEQGLVRRASRGRDRRTWVLEVTEAGTRARDLVVSRQVAALSAALASLSAEELQTVEDTLTMLERLVERDA